MSTIDTTQSDDTDDTDHWETLANNQDTLEMLVEEETAFATYAQHILDALEDRGYR